MTGTDLVLRNTSAHYRAEMLRDMDERLVGIRKDVEEALERLLSENPPADTEPRAFLGAQFDLGLAWVHYDEGFGGLGLAAKHQKTINERISAAGGPMAQADQAGLFAVLRRCQTLSQLDAGLWTPHPLLVQLQRNGRRFQELDLGGRAKLAA